MFEFVRTLATTVYGRIGTDYVRMTLAVVRIEDVETVAWTRADGSHGLITTLPTEYRTARDVTSTAAKLGHAVDVASIPYGEIDSTWTSYTLSSLRKHATQGVALKANYKALKATYAQPEQQKAA